MSGRRTMRTVLRILGGDTKAFFGRDIEGSRLSIAGYRGVVSYEPTELVVTARAGTRVSDLEALLAEQGQMPPRVAPAAPLRTPSPRGLSGPRRPYGGSVRDAVLGVRCLTAAGEVLRFGGQVMKNVAGFDLSRLLCGAFGTAGHPPGGLGQGPAPSQFRDHPHGRDGHRSGDPANESVGTKPVAPVGRGVRRPGTLGTVVRRAAGVGTGAGGDGRARPSPRGGVLGGGARAAAPVLSRRPAAVAHLATAGDPPPWHCPETG